jgi:hypothetical protein
LNIKDNVLAVLRREEPERVPWLPDMGVLPTGSLERELRNKGMGLFAGASVMDTTQPHVRVERREEGDDIFTTYRTPVGCVSTVQTLDYAQSEEFYRIPWTKEYMVKNLTDLEVLKFMMEDIEYRPNYRPFLEREHWMGDDGVVGTGCDRTPFHKILLEFTGYKNGIILLQRFPKEFEDLRGIIERKQDEAYGILADSPADLILMYDNIDAVMISPRLFEKYYVPFYNRQARLLHKRDKIYACHMDGRLRCLSALIGETDLDVINAFTPPPMGDLPISVAKKAWGDKVIWINFPETVCHYGVDELKSYTLGLLEECAPGNNVIMGVTETVPSKTIETTFSIITELLWKHGRYPLSYVN